ncbi:response regulator transcription factor [Methylobacterium nonmethylotrophicum]|uniref:Response regulator n=1 Tax=Methylobacterium nonmethylotrophicum TaxID=1141884 RepID=A0A4Z0NMV3_9HYPH|nr:response regulator [Methylobacterium nonmethylotrophicum]TGD97725.1 response regulator [Methylobacterium nonmethylotrophicum]
MTQEATIAIVDDDEGVRLSMASLVRSLGYLVRTYASGSDFLRDALDQEPAVMISDLRMPGMNGDELQARLLADGRRFPIIFLTGYATDAIKQRVLDAGATCLLSKPADGETIVRCIEQALDRSRVMHQAIDVSTRNPPEIAVACVDLTTPAK